MATDETLSFKFQQKTDNNEPIILVDVDETLYNMAGLNTALINYLRGKPNIYLFTKMDRHSIDNTLTYLINDHFEPAESTQKYSFDKYYIRFFLLQLLLMRGVIINDIITPSDINIGIPGDFYKQVFMKIDKFILNYNIENYVDNNDYSNLNDKTTQRQKIKNFIKYKTDQISTLKEQLNKYINTEIDTDLINKNINPETKAEMFKFTYKYFTKHKYSSFIYIDDDNKQLDAVLTMANEIKTQQNINLKVIKSIIEKDTEKNMYDDVIFITDYENAIPYEIISNKPITGGSKLKYKKYKNKTHKYKTHKTKKYLFRKQITKK